MQIVARNIQEIEADVLITGIFEDNKTLNEIQKTIDEKTGNIVTGIVLGVEDFKGKFCETYIIPCAHGKKIIAVGLGKKEEFNADKLREVAAKVSKQAEKLTKNKIVAIEAMNNGLMDANSIIYNISEGALIANYEFDKYKSTKAKDKVETLEIITEMGSAANYSIERAQIIASAMSFTKDLINEPADFATPSMISQAALKMANENGLEVKIFSKDELETMNFGAFLAVGKGGENEAKFVHIKYAPEKPARKIAIIGKGVTFDSGGLNLKPAASMMTMKTDMSGSATVLGVIQAIAKFKPDVEVHALTALCENMPSSTSYKMGDVLKAKNGKTIEVDNTDAEGRLTLADVLCYADELKVDEVIDIATLTGAVVVALGQNITGVMGNNEDMIKKFIEVGKKSGEILWQLPLMDDMQESLKSDIADMKNTGSRGAGSSTAGRFLQNFTESKNWLHIDIAGTAFIEKPYRELSKGATAVMLRTLTNYILEK